MRPVQSDEGDESVEEEANYWDVKKFRKSSIDPGLNHLGILIHQF